METSHGALARSNELGSIVPRLLLGGAQAAPMQHHLECADDLQDIRLQAIERGSERRPE
jgi:hypothetical protein